MPRSTPEQRALAREMAAAGRSLGQIAYRTGFSKQAIRRWLDPDLAESERRRVSDYRAANRERLNAHARAYMRRQRKGICPSCRKPTPRAGVKECRRCREEDRAFLWAEIERHWAAGMRVREIAAVVGRPPHTIAAQIRAMRDAGRNVPRRRG